MAAAKKGAARLLGCYRVGDAHDPETYISAVVSVLARFPTEIIDRVTEPSTGLASKVKWLPTVAEVREACDAEATEIATHRRYAALPKPVFSRMAPVRREPGAFATIFVPPEAPQYPRMLARTKKPDVDPREWRYDETRQGIWVCFSWLDGSQMEMKRFEPFTDEQLRERYRRSCDIGGESHDIPGGKNQAGSMGDSESHDIMTRET